jgi:hypothetical protein
MNGRFQMQGDKNRILPKEMNLNRSFWDSHWLEIWSNHLFPSMGLDGRSVTMDSGELNLRTTRGICICKIICWTMLKTTKRSLVISSGAVRKSTLTIISNFMLITIRARRESLVEVQNWILNQFLEILRKSIIVCFLSLSAKTCLNL